MKMITKIPHQYAGRELSEGDEFDCEDDHVVLLTVLGRAEVIAAPGEMHNGAPVSPALVRAASQRAILKRRAP